MQHKSDNGNQKMIVKTKQSDLERREAVRTAILRMAKAAVDKFGGAAIIDDHYMFVDTRKYLVSPIPPTPPKAIKKGKAVRAGGATPDWKGVGDEQTV